MKRTRYWPALLVLFFLFFSAPLWAEDKVHNKAASSDHSSDIEVTAKTEQKASAAASGQKSSAAPESDDNKTAAQEAANVTREKAQAERKKTRPSRKLSSSNIPKEADYWVGRVDKLVEERGQADIAEIDVLYGQLNVAFDHNSQILKSSLRKKPGESDVINDLSGHPGGVSYQLPSSQNEIYHTLQTVYYQRLRLLSHASEKTRADLTGTGIEGMQELYRELTFLGQTIHYRVDALPQFQQHFLSELRIAPLPTIGHILQFLFVIILFRYWRRWASDGLYNIRQRLLDVRPQREINLKLAKFIWFFDQLKSPIAWFVLVGLLFSFVKDPVLMFFIEVTRITAIWILLSWMGVLFVNALISRNSGAMAPETAALTQRSLRYFGVWVVVGGLTLDLISRYIGEGTLHTWVMSVSEVLLLILVVVFVAIWQKTVLQKLERDPRQNTITKAVLNNRKGLIGYLYTSLGIGYLIFMYLSKRSVEWMTYFNAGQQVLDSMLDLEIAKAYQRQQEVPDAKPVSPELEEKLMGSKDVLIEEAGSDVLRKILDRANNGPGGVLMLVGEKGGGKTVLLRRVSRETPKKSIFVSCPKEGLGGLMNSLARSLHIDEESKPRVVFEELKRQKVEVLLIDNIHLLIRPYIDGQEQLNKLAKIFDYAPDVLCVLSSNVATWQYCLCVRSKRLLDRNALILRPWSVEQMALLIKNSCQTAEIDPDFSQIVIPAQFDNNNYDDPKERAFSGFVRILHGVAAGNPLVAMSLWAKSLYIDKSGQVVARLPRLPSSEDLDNANLTLLLVLRVICQSELITHKDILKSLQISDAEVRNALLLAMYKKWVNLVDDEYYQLNWYWRKAVAKVLSRQNLMSRNV